jgi:hypothetical protein
MLTVGLTFRAGDRPLWMRFKLSPGSAERAPLRLCQAIEDGFEIGWG